MAAKEMLSLYDAMIRMFVVSMPNDKISMQLLSYVLSIPIGTLKKALDTCPLPNGVQLTRGGHRSLEIFITQPTFTASIGRCELVNEIRKESVWKNYELTLNPHSEEIIIEVEKVLDNIKKLKGTTAKKLEMLEKGDPKAYRVMWFSRDLINGEYYNTIQLAIKKDMRHHGPVCVVPLKGKSEPMVKEAASLGIPVKRVTMDQYGLLQFVTDVQELIISKNQYLVIIKQMEDKINKEYPALISQKEAEKAAAERQVEHLLDRVKVLEKINADQMTEIRNLKKHPKFAGMVKASELRK
jgi:hypothetical protein